MNRRAFASIAIVSALLCATAATASAQTTGPTRVIQCLFEGQLRSVQTNLTLPDAQICEQVRLAWARQPGTAPPASNLPPTCGGEPVTIYGTSGNDQIVGTDGDDVIHALQGNDRVRAGDGDDIICGGTGDDILEGGLGFDVIYGAQGNDRLEATSQAASAEDTAGSRMFGGAGNDIIRGSNRWDRMQGGPGNDVLRDGDRPLELGGARARDWMRGGPGNDSIESFARDDISGGLGHDLLVFERAQVRKSFGIDGCRILRISGNPNNNYPTNPDLDGCDGLDDGSDIVWPVTSPWSPADWTSAPITWIQ